MPIGRSWPRCAAVRRPRRSRSRLRGPTRGDPCPSAAGRRRGPPCPRPSCRRVRPPRSPPICPAAAEDAVLEGEVRGAPLALAPAFGPCRGLASRLVDAGAADRHGARAEGAGPEGTASASTSTTSTTRREPEHVSRDLAEARGMALPVLIAPEKTVARPSAWTTTRALSWPARRKSTELIPIERPTPELSEKVVSPMPNYPPPARSPAPRNAR